MEVNKDNFFQILPQIEKAIAECDFLALDLEMTGLTSGKMERQKPWDSPQQRYLKIRDSAQAICPTQFGLCTFKYHADRQVYEAQPYNIYIFPREFKWVDRHFTIQTSSLSFLREHRFDFNKWMDLGVTWLSMEQHSQMSTRLMAAFEEHVARPVSSAPEGDKVQLSDKDQKWIDGIYALIDEWKTKIPKNATREEKTLIFDKTRVKTSFQRLLLYQELPKRYPEMMVGSDKDATTGERVVKISSMTQAEHDAEVQVRREALQQEIREAFGFGHVFKAIVDAKKPVLGHNMFLDLCLCFHHFFKPLPDEESEFCSELHAALPKIMDTKTVATKHEDLEGLAFDTTALGPLSEIVLDRFPDELELPKVDIHGAFSRYKLPTVDAVRAKLHPNTSIGARAAQALLLYNENNKLVHVSIDSASDDAYHEAGFDALQTGVLFLNLAAFFCTGLPPTDPILDDEDIKKLQEAAAKLLGVKLPEVAASSSSAEGEKEVHDKKAETAHDKLKESDLSISGDMKDDQVAKKKIRSPIPVKRVKSAPEPSAIQISMPYSKKTLDDAPITGEHDKHEDVDAETEEEGEEFNMEYDQRRVIVHPLLPTGEYELPYMNALYLMQISGTFNLDREHDLPERALMYLLTGLTKDDKTSHITELFEPLGGAFKISWVDSTSCILAFQEPFDAQRDMKIVAAPRRSIHQGKWHIDRLTDLDASGHSVARSVRASMNKPTDPFSSSNLTSFAVGAAAAVAVTLGLVAWFGMPSRTRRRSIRN